MLRQKLTTRPRTAVTALYAGWRVSSNFLPAERNVPSAPKLSAACSFCSGVSVFRVPNQVNMTRTAAVVVRSRWLGAVLVGMWIVGSSSNVLLIGLLVVVRENRRGPNGGCIESV